MIVNILIEADRCRNWLTHLADLLACRRDIDVRFQFIASAVPVPSALSSLLTFERMFVHRGRTCASDVSLLSRHDLKRSNADPADCTIDLTAKGVASAQGRVLRPLYNGIPGEDALVAALMTSGTPLIEIENVTQGSVAARGTASLEDAAGLGGAMEAVYSRVAILLQRVLSGTDDALAGATPAPSSDLTPKMAGLAATRLVASTAAKALYRLGFWAPQWRVGWRFVNDDDVLSRQNLGGTPWNILESPQDHFYADPFPIQRNGRNYLFFEDLDHKTQKGVISVVEVDANGPTGPAEFVLEEPWHLSYPFLFEWDGEIWMIPESSAVKEVAVYRAVEFPHHWERHAVILSGVEAADATIVSHNNRLWMFAVVRNGTGGYSDTLCIYHSDSLFGPWEPHDANPVLVDDRTARPAGRMVMRDNQLWRPVQDCRNGYGAGLGLAQVTMLDESHFEQRVDTVLYPDSRWPGRKLHTLNRSGSLETIDGCIYHPKSRLASRFTSHHYLPERD